MECCWIFSTLSSFQLSFFSKKLETLSWRLTKPPSSSLSSPSLPSFQGSSTIFLPQFLFHIHCFRMLEVLSLVFIGANTSFYITTHYRTNKKPLAWRSSSIIWYQEHRSSRRRVLGSFSFVSTIPCFLPLFTWFCTYWK